MKRLAVLLGIVVACGLSTPAHAYWDDLHFHLTYYEARLVGFTPEQAYRIAAADLATDWDSATEPGQMSDLDYLTGVRADLPEKQAPRWRYHALRNQSSVKECVGNAPGAQKADEAIRKQAGDLYTAALTSRNPGIFLHFAQDRGSHRAFGSAWGHYFDPDDLVGSTEEARKAGLAIGGSVDWLSHYTKKENVDLVYSLANWLNQYMARVSPHQKGRREFSFTDSEGMLDALRDRNPAPSALAKEEFQTYIDYVKAANKLGKAPALDARQSRDFPKHKDGPNLNAARDAVNAQILAMGMIEKAAPEYVAARKKYRFNASGTVIAALDRDGKSVADPLDEWVIVGALKLSLKPGSGGERSPVEVVIKAPPTMAGETEYDLTRPETLRPGESRIVKDLPVGEVIVELRRDGKLLKRETGVRLTKQENAIEIGLSEKPWRLRSDSPKMRWRQRTGQFELAAGYPRFTPDASNWKPVSEPPLGDYQCRLLPGGSVSLLYIGSQWSAGQTCEITLSETLAVIRHTVVEGEKTIRYVFELALTRLPEEVRPGDLINASLVGKASIVGTPLNLANLPTLEAELHDGFSTEPKLLPLRLGRSGVLSGPGSGGAWAPEGKAETSLSYVSDRGLGWGMVGYRFAPYGDLSMSVSLDYVYEQEMDDAKTGSDGEPSTPTGADGVGTAPGTTLGGSRPTTGASSGVGGRWILEGGGTLDLQQQGNTVTGSYTAIGGSGTVSGTLADRNFNGTFVHRWKDGAAETGPMRATLTGDDRLEAYWTIRGQELHATASRAPSAPGPSVEGARSGPANLAPEATAPPSASMPPTPPLLTPTPSSGTPSGTVSVPPPPVVSTSPSRETSGVARLPGTSDSPIPPGLGVRMGVANGRVVVTSVEGNSLAALMDIKPGDRILRIDGRSTEGMTAKRVQELLRGETGKALNVELLREADSSVLSVTITRSLGGQSSPGSIGPPMTDTPPVPAPPEPHTAPLPLPKRGDADGRVVAWYRFDEGTGNVTRDSSGNGLDLALHGKPGFVGGIQGLGLQLRNFSDQFAGRDIDDTLLNLGDRDFALGMGCRFYDFSHEQVLMEKFTGSAGPGWTLTLLSGKVLQFYTSGAGSYNAAVDLQPNEWYRFLVRRRSGRLQILVDGRVVLDEGISGTISASASPLLIGKRNTQDGRDFPLHGVIDEFRITLW